MVYTAAAPANALLRKAVSVTEPTRAVAPSASISFARLALLVMTATSCPAFSKAMVRGLLMLPREPVITYFILLCILLVKKYVFNQCIFVYTTIESKKLYFQFIGYFAHVV